MKLRAFFARANRLQQQRLFKIIATCVVLAAALAGFVTYAIAAGKQQGVSFVERAPSGSPAPEGGMDPNAAAAEGEEAQLRAQAQMDRDVARKTVDVLNGILAAKQDTTVAGLGIGLLAALLIGVVWLGLALTYLGLAIATTGLVLLTMLARLPQATGPLIVGIAALTASFTALMRLAGLALGGALPPLAIAKNVLDEAVRMKISVVFIVLIIFGLAALPGLLDKEAFLRYRVQSFLQYGTGGTFWLIAVLVLTFSVSSVAFEQRDKVIWQTMTKPVAAWQYIFGKWLGVVTLAAVLLAVSASGVFLFTEYLRAQPATGETEAYVSAREGDISEDRFLLETQVLAARERRQPDLVELDQATLDANIEEGVQRELKQMRDSGERDAMILQNEQAIRERYRVDLPKTFQAEYRRIDPGQGRLYRYSNLQGVREGTSPLMLKLKINAGSNSPDQLYKITVWVPGDGMRIVEMPLNQVVSMRPPMLPTAVDANGVLEIGVYNADYSKNPPVANPEAIGFPPDGLELSYSNGGYRANFFRCIGTLWVKLAFLSMLAICASTFLSFPVACLVAFTVFIAAEGSEFILGALEGYQTETRQGETIIFNTAVSHIASVVGRAFKVYADLQPTERLVEGLRLSWSQVALGTTVLSVATAALFVAATLIFRRRELATYSGH